MSKVVQLDDYRRDVGGGISPWCFDDLVSINLSSARELLFTWVMLLRK